MSLTRELNKKQSPFRQLVEGCAPALAMAGGRSPEGKRVALSTSVSTISSRHAPWHHCRME